VKEKILNELVYKVLSSYKGIRPAANIGDKFFVGLGDRQNQNEGVLITMKLQRRNKEIYFLPLLFKYLLFRGHQLPSAIHILKGYFKNNSFGDSLKV
jgi:hypothetical protein